MELMRKQGMSEEGVGNHQTWRLGVRILKWRNTGTYPFMRLHGAITPKTEAPCSSEALVLVFKTIWCHNPEDPI
jgi:hypothetical protein